jgi:hypothetical protein
VAFYSRPLIVTNSTNRLGVTRMLNTVKPAGGKLLQAGKYVITWQWTTGLLSWLIMSAGTVSGCVFLIAGLWIMVNASVHPFILLLMPEATTKVLTWLADTAYVGLPEFILPLALVTVYAHYCTWRYTRQRASMIWFILFAIPTAFFLLISVLTLGFSLANVTFTLPVYIVIPRGIAAFFYALFSLLYPLIGQPQEADRLREKDTKLAELQQKSAADLAELRKEKDTKLAELQTDKEKMAAQYQEEIARIREELQSVYRQLSEAIGEKNAAYTALNQSADSALQAYGEHIIAWLNSLDKTVSVEDICTHLGWHRRRIMAAIERKELQTRGPNKNLIWVPSLRDYLRKHAPKEPLKERDTGPMFRVIGG